MRCAWFGCLRNCQRPPKRRFLENKCCDQARQSEQIIARPIADAAERNGATGASDIDGNAVRAAGASQFVAKCGDSLRELEETAYWLQLLVDGKIVAPEKLSDLRQECDELIAIFVTIRSDRRRFLNFSFIPLTLRYLLA